MPNYTVKLTRKAEKQLDKLPDQIAFPILDDMHWLGIQDLSAQKN